MQALQFITIWVIFGNFLIIRKISLLSCKSKIIPRFFKVYFQIIEQQRQHCFLMTQLCNWSLQEKRSTLYNQPFLSMCFTSKDSIIKKIYIYIKLQKVPKLKLQIYHVLATICISFTLYQVRKKFRDDLKYMGGCVQFICKY